MCVRVFVCVCVCDKIMPPAGQHRLRGSSLLAVPQQRGTFPWADIWTRHLEAAQGVARATAVCARVYVCALVCACVRVCAPVCLSLLVFSFVRLRLINLQGVIGVWIGCVCV